LCLSTSVDLIAQVSNTYKNGDLVEVKVLYGENDERTVMAEIQGEYLIIEGDIIIGKVKELNTKSAAINQNSSGRWSNSTIPYTIDPGLTDVNRINLAITHINDNTNLCIIPRTTETDYITFRVSSGCSSYIGKIGGQQHINLSSGCQWIETTHEILHAAGFYHEHSRDDRDSYVTIHYDNIEDGFEGSFEKYSTGQDIGTYDYGSIMHYLHFFFACSGCGSTITKVGGGTDFGPDYDNGMSAIDILGVNALYPINGNCDLEPCTTSIGSITSANANDASTITSSNSLSTTGTITIIANPVRWKAEESILLNSNFSVNVGCTFTLEVGDCEEP